MICFQISSDLGKLNVHFQFNMSEEGEGTYVCTLDDAALKKAKDELNEDPAQRASQVETLRQWVKSQPHLKSRTGRKINHVMLIENSSPF